MALIGLFIIYMKTGHLDTHATNYFGFIFDELSVSELPCSEAGNEDGK